MSDKAPAACAPPRRALCQQGLVHQQGRTPNRQDDGATPQLPGCSQIQTEDYGNPNQHEKKRDEQPLRCRASR
ncbi:MAG: hypothetical protein IPK48_06420 [Gammaproteobacteria bacterium]|nr:hypothetical protein [Gammaproteobacteria bacterium]